MLAALDPTLSVSAKLILACIFVGTIISQPGRTLALCPTLAQSPVHVENVGVALLRITGEATSLVNVIRDTFPCNVAYGVDTSRHH